MSCLFKHAAYATNYFDQYTFLSLHIFRAPQVMSSFYFLRKHPLVMCFYFADGLTSLRNRDGPVVKK